ncbi:HD domain-containing protein [Lacrimispora sp.]|uniref:HD domain-containing protein n=1 Tax=Lacrimispora sp. TaxID=2719234 RepID=UPI00289C5C14|nr:HD domain-containing protein [Lacrimispora sp.]
MNRIEKVREYVDTVLLTMTDTTERRCGYLHLYGVSQACTLIALKRNENAELATIAGMLHDIYSYAAMDTKEHAHKGSIMAREILYDLKVFTENEVDIICSAIYNHSSKGTTHSPFDEVLKDADVLQHCLYNPLFDVLEHEKARYEKLKSEFGLGNLKTFCRGL